MTAVLQRGHADVILLRISVGGTVANTTITDVTNDLGEIPQEVRSHNINLIPTAAFVCGFSLTPNKNGVPVLTVIELSDEALDIHLEPRSIIPLGSISKFRKPIVDERLNGEEQWPANAMQMEPLGGHGNRAN